MDFHEVPTTCTAKQISNWDLSGRRNENPIAFEKYNLKLVESLIQQGFFLDFAMLFAIVTHEQMESYHLEPFFEKLGFTKSFVGEKGGDKNRHKETGSLYMWCVSPADYKEALESYKKELVARLAQLDRRKVDPKRQAMPDMLLRDLRKAELVRPNAFVDNRIRDVMMPGVEAATVAFFIKQKFGLDVVETFGANWTEKNSRVIKEAQQKWKAELIPY